MNTATEDRPMLMQVNETEAKVDFHHFSDAVRQQFEKMSLGELYIVDMDVNELWDAYLAAFPKGTNEIFRERTEHDCSCCKHFIRNLGPVVAIDGEYVTTVWDVSGVGYPYDGVADVMAALVRSYPVKTVYRSSESQFGAAETRELRDGETITWNHFSGKLARDHRMSSGIGEFSGKMRSTYDVFKRGLDELTPESFDIVLDLISQGALYRGNEFEPSIREFKTAQESYRRSENKSLFVWRMIKVRAAKFRNSAIGSLLVDLSDGEELESAVRAYESKVAPENYQRPTSLITKPMIDKAIADLDGLGLRDAIDRRHARISDVSVNDVLFVDNSVQTQMKDALADMLMESAKPSSVRIEDAEEISIDKFVKNVLPVFSGVDLFLEGRHTRSLMSVTAPAKEDVGQLFKWDNDFAWSYNGDVTDSIKQKVKRAGGNVEAVMRVSLAWFNTDDLDIHVIEPDRNHIYYGNKCGKLDIDMNAFRLVRDPVENVSWSSRPKDGVYKVQVRNFQKRESVDVGFQLEFDMDGTVLQYEHSGAVPNNKYIHALNIVVNKGQMVSVENVAGMSEGASSQDVWGLSTESLIPVDSIITSPNHWGENNAGAKHWFFLLRGCNNPDPVRGIYNEFLSTKLAKHKKVFEVLGSKTKCPVSEDQLSGVGFTSAKDDGAKVVVRGQTQSRAFHIKF